MVKSAGMKALHGLFSGNAKPISLPADLNAQIITVSITLHYLYNARFDGEERAGCFA